MQTETRRDMYWLAAPAVILVVAVAVVFGGVGCQSITYHTEVTVTGPVPVAASGTTPAIHVEVRPDAASIDKPVEVSPGRELSPARAAQLRDNQVQGVPGT